MAVSWADWLLDGALVLLLLGLSVRILVGRELFEATVLFVAFGLALSLAWVRVGAPDLALAEAALGAGVTGALLLNAFHRLARKVGEGTSPSVLVDPGQGDSPRWIRWALTGGGAAVAAGLGGLILSLPARDPILPALVARHLDESGVTNPVTAVLLNFRAYDTLLEVGVLVVAMVAIWSMDRGTREFARDPEELREDPVLGVLTRLAVPLAGVTAVYLVWAGSHAPGGAFQAGALLAGAGVLLVAAGFLGPVTAAAAPTRVLGVSGLALFTAVGVAVMVPSGAFLAYPAEAASLLILGLEVVLALSIAVILVEVFVDVPALPAKDPALVRVHPTGDPLGRALTADRAAIRGAEEAG